MDEKTNKERTSITISPDLWHQAKRFCAARTSVGGKKFSFSELVEAALTAYFEKEGPDQ